MDIKVLGSGCCDCGNAVRLIEAVAEDLGVQATVTKVQDLQHIVSYGVMSTPAIVLDGVVVHAGSTPTRAQIAKWLAPVAAQA